MPKRTALEEHAMARTSAYSTAHAAGAAGATCRDVVRSQGLVEIRAKRALEELRAAGRVSKVRGRYFASRRTG